jgi:hypothetical protein
MTAMGALLGMDRGGLRESAGTIGIKPEQSLTARLVPVAKGRIAALTAFY